MTVEEIAVLANQNCAGPLGEGPDHIVRPAREANVLQMICGDTSLADPTGKGDGKLIVDQKIHSAASGRKSRTACAYSIAAVMSSSVM